jgi:hypothetical protein
MKTRDFFKERGEIAKKLTLDSPEKIDEAFSYSKYLYQCEEFRMHNIERKAYTINAVALIATVLITWLFSSIIYERVSISLSILIMFVTIYIFIAYFLLQSITYSIKTSNYENHKMSIRDFSKIYNLRDDDINRFKNSLAVDYFIAHDKIKKINDEKEMYLNKAQKNIKIIIILLLFLSLVFLIDAALSKKIHARYISTILEWISKSR